MTSKDTKLAPLERHGTGGHPERSAPQARATLIARMAATALAAGSVWVGDAGEGRAQSAPAAAITVGAVPNQAVRVLRDSYGRQVTLRGFNVSASSKLVESALLPFHSTDDAALSAQAMRDQTGANVVRFLITWEGV